MATVIIFSPSEETKTKLEQLLKKEGQKKGIGSVFVMPEYKEVPPKGPKSPIQYWFGCICRIHLVTREISECWLESSGLYKFLEDWMATVERNRLLSLGNYNSKFPPNRNRTFFIRTNWRRIDEFYKKNEMIPLHPLSPNLHIMAIIKKLNYRKAREQMMSLLYLFDLCKKGYSSKKMQIWEIIFKILSN